MFFCAFLRADKEEEKLILGTHYMVCISVYASSVTALGMIRLGNHQGSSVNRHAGIQCVGLQNLKLCDMVQFKEAVTMCNLQ